jgi:glycosyltransferase involved in cell wall biosynthesis
MSAIDKYNLGFAKYIPVGVDFEFWSNTDYHERHGLQTMSEFEVSDILTLICVGNINPVKNYSDLLTAIEQLTFPLNLQIVGQNLNTHKEYFNDLLRRSHELMNDREDLTIKFLGQKSPSEIRYLLNCSDVYILCSKSEACPTSLLEAVSVGLPCISSDVGDAKLILESHQTSFMYSGLQQLVDVLNNLKLNISPESRQKQELHKRYHTINVAQSLLRLYKEILELEALLHSLRK